MSGPLVLDADDNALISDWKLSKEEEQDDGWLEGRPDLLPLREPDQKIPPLWTIDDHGQIVLNFHPGQKRAWDATRRVIAIIAGAQSGKALALDTLLPQPRGGYVSMRDIRVGDQVYDAGFNPVTVTYVSPVFRNHECFKLDFSCDDAVVADAEHLWPVGDQLADGTWATITSRELHNRFWRVEDIWIASGSKSAQCLEYSQRVNSVDTRCISVDSPSSTYLCTQGYVPTHNTSYAPLWLWREIQRRGAGDYMAVTPTWPLAKKKLLPEIIRFFGDTMHLGKFRPGDRVFEISKDGGMALYGEATNSYIFLGSAISPESLESATAKAVLLDEAGQQQFRLEAWEAVNRRVSLHKGRILITTTPYNLGFLKCVAGDTRLIKADGTRVRIDAIDQNQLIVTVDVDGKIRNNRVKNKWFQGNKPAFVVTTQSGRSITSTDIHPFLTSRGWSALRDISIRERIAVPRRLPCGSETDFRARLLGWILAEGGISQPNGVKITLGEPEAVEDVRRSLPEGTWLNYYSKYEYSIRSKGQNRFCPNPVLDWLRDLRLSGHTAHTKFIPEVVFSWDAKTRAELLAGLFSGDGSVGHRRVYLCTVSSRLAHDTQELLLGLGILSQVAKTKNAWYVLVTHHESLKAFSDQINLMPRKQARLRQELSHPQRHGGRAIGNNDRVPICGKWESRLLSEVNDDILWDKVVSIVPSGELPTWDVEIEGTHNFIGNAIFAHNTEVYDKWLDGDPNITVIQYSSTQNPLFDPTEMERQRQVLPDWKFELFYRGRFAKPSHLIYGSFNDTPAPGGHLIEPFDVPNDWARWIGVDFGGANTALLFTAEHPISHELFVYDEWMPGPNLSTPETVGEAKRRLQGVNGPITLVGGSQSEGQLRQDWAMAGLAIEEPKIYDVEAGINRGIALLKTKRIGIFKTASGIRSEFGAYSRPTDAKGEVLTGIQHKNRFHRLDAYRYIATWVESGPIGGANLIIISGARDRRLRR